MDLIKIIKTVDDKMFEVLPELRDLAGSEVEITVRKTEPEPTPVPRRRGGWAKGKLWMSDDFDAPLEDFKDYM